MHACTYTYDNVIERKREVHNMSLICPTYVPNMSLMSLIRPEYVLYTGGFFVCKDGGGSENRGKHAAGG